MRVQSHTSKEEDCFHLLTLLWRENFLFNDVDNFVPTGVFMAVFLAFFVHVKISRECGISGYSLS